MALCVRHATNIFYNLICMDNVSKLAAVEDDNLL